MPRDFRALYQKYQGELVTLSQAMRKNFYLMQSKGLLTTFGDVEGEVLYMLVRENRPGVVFEISPNAGWSTNYILAALTKNGTGTLHSFDILTHMDGRPMEEVIRSNQCSLCNPKQHVIHIGDARERVNDVQGTVDFALIDSLHTDAFAEWYVANVFPRVQGTIVIQDIAFYDRMESSSEASYIWKWLKDEKIDFQMIGKIERDIRATALRDAIVERRGLRSNSLILDHPYVRREEAEILDLGPDDYLLRSVPAALKAGDKAKAMTDLTIAVAILTRDTTRVNRHRLFFKAAEHYRALGESEESRRMAQRALGIAVMSDLQQRKKLYPELMILFLRQGRVNLLLQTMGHVILEPHSWWLALKALVTFTAQVLHIR